MFQTSDTVITPKYSLQAASWAISATLDLMLRQRFSFQSAAPPVAYFMLIARNLTTNLHFNTIYHDNDSDDDI